MAASPSSPDHVHAPQQDRSRRTLERIVDAALALFAERGVEATTVNEIVSRADSSVGSFYARFDGKDALVRHLEERVWSRARSAWDEALESRGWSELTLEELVRGLVSSLERLHHQGADVRDAFARDGQRSGRGDDRRRGFHRHVGEGVRALLLERRGRIRHPDPDLAASVAYRWILAGIRALTRDAELPDVDRLDREVVVEEVARGVLAYLGAGGGEPGDAEAVEFFDVWA